MEVDELAPIDPTGGPPTPNELLFSDPPPARPRQSRTITLDRADRDSEVAWICHRGHPVVTTTGVLLDAHAARRAKVVI